MALEIAIFDERGRPSVTEMVGTDDHEDLMKVAEIAGAKYLLRMWAYYGRVDIACEELPSFREELKSLLATVLLSPGLRDLIDRVAAMATQAIREGRKMGTIPD
jgi:hypothetical protein